MRSIDAIGKPYIDNESILGAAVAVLQEGEIVYLGGFGSTSVGEGSLGVSPHTLFSLGSISKTICATLIMRLVEAELLQLDAPVFEYLPGLKFSNPVYGSKITLRHLLSHTSGLPAAGKDWGPRDPDSLKRFVYEQIPHYSFLAEPGVVHLYSNTAFCIAGHVAEQVIGKYYESLVQEYVLDPLQMNRTTYDPAVALTYPVALPHESGPEGELSVIHRIACNASGNPSGFAYGSVSNLANLAKMFINQDDFAGQGFLKASSIAEMHRMHASRHIGGHAHPLAHANQGYGLGFYTGHYKGKRAARHGGVSQSYNCFFDLFPDDRAGIVLLTNYSQEEPLMELLATLYDHVLDLTHPGIVYLGQPATVSSPRNIGEPSRYTGTYLNMENARLATFTVQNDRLLLDRHGESLELIPSGDARYFARVSEQYRLPVAFIKDSNQTITHVMIAGDPYFPIAIKLKDQLDPQHWNSYEGIYKDPSNFNPEEVLSVRLVGEVLYIAEGEHEVPSRAIGNRCFLTELGLVEFEDTDLENVKCLVWGKAVRYYPIDPHEYRVKGVARYLTGMNRDK